MQQLALPGVLDYVVYGTVKCKQTGQPLQSWHCGLCKYYNKKKFNVEEHMYYRHCAKEDLPCQYCGVRFARRPAWKRHVSQCAKRQLFAPPPLAPLHAPRMHQYE